MTADSGTMNVLSVRETLGLGGTGMDNTNTEVYRIYQNCSKHMQNTPRDWEKAFNAFRSVLKKHKSAQAINDDIQQCILALEEQFKEII